MCETEVYKILYHIMNPPLAKFYRVLCLQSGICHLDMGVLPSGSVCTTGVQERFSDIALFFVAKTEFSRCKTPPFIALVSKVCPNSLRCEGCPGSFLVIADPCGSLTPAIHLVWEQWSLLQHHHRASLMETAQKYLKLK